MNLGILLRERQDNAGAREQMLEAQQIRREQLDSGDLRLRRDYAQGFYNIARLEWQAARNNFV